MRTLLSLITIATAVTYAENSLAKFIINKTEEATPDEPTPCFRAEFVLKVRVAGNTTEFKEIEAITGLGNHNIGPLSSCDRLVVKDISFEEKKLSLDIRIKVLEKAGDKEWWEVTNMTVISDEKIFVNDSITRISAPLSGTWGQSFLCNAGFDVQLWNEDQTDHLSIHLERLQMQPIKVPADTFANPIICSEDINIVIPAIVGSILGVLVIVVLVTYIIGRKRTRIAYQEI